MTPCPTSKAGPYLGLEAVQNHVESFNAFIDGIESDLDGMVSLVSRNSVMNTQQAGREKDDRNWQ